MNCVCGAPVDPFLLTMCKACFLEWVDVKTASWLRTSRRKPDEYRLKVAA